MVEIGFKKASALKSFIRSHEDLTISVDSKDKNLWLQAFNSIGLILLYRVGLAAFGLVCIVLAVQRLYSLFNQNDLLPVPGYILVVELITNLVRFLYYTVDPVFSSGIFPSFLSRYLITMTVPWS